MTDHVNPTEVRGWVNDIINGHSDWHFWYPWLINLKNTKTFVHLSAGWGLPNKAWPSLPEAGYEYYVLSGDSGVPGWGEHVVDVYQKPVIVIGLPEVYQPSTHELVTYIPNIYYHRQILKLSELLTGKNFQKNICYKASALTNRITQSKVIVFSALKQILKNDCILSLRNNNFELKNMHYWELTQNQRLDELTLFFKENFLGKKITIKNDTGDQLSIDIPAYIESALNFTQESFHYSLMYDAEKDYSQILSGPFLTEKTFKCLLSKTAFIPTGQFRNYGWLETMGMKFDYGLDLSFDADPGNITRLDKLVDLIQDISRYSAQDLFEMTEDSTNFNYNLITSGDFYENCDSKNSSDVLQLYEKILG